MNTDWQGKVRITAPALELYSSPDLSDAGTNAGDTIDGKLHLNDLVDVTGYSKQSQGYVLHTTNGYLLASGTDFPTPEGVKPYETTYTKSVCDKVIAKPLLVHDFEGVMRDFAAPVGTTFHQAGIFSVDGVMYARSVFAESNGKWIGVPVDAFSHTSPHVIDLNNPPIPQKLSKPEKAIGVVAATYGQYIKLRDYIVAAFKQFHSK